MNKYMLIPAATVALFASTIAPASAKAATNRSTSFSTANSVLPGWHDEEIMTKTGSIKVTDEGSTAKGGWVEFTGEGTVTVKTVKVQNTVHSHPRPMGMVTKNVGGGEWTYGSSLNWRGKYCESEYLHTEIWHSATAQMGNTTHSDSAVAGYYALATVNAYTSATCVAHWSHA